MMFIMNRLDHYYMGPIVGYYIFETEDQNSINYLLSSLVMHLGRLPKKTLVSLGKSRFHAKACTVVVAFLVSFVTIATIGFIEIPLKSRFHFIFGNLPYSSCSLI